ncbi:MAG: type II secretion system protein GspF [Thermodesulfatator sp.]|nr:MAG: type II secretion system protein GspF [Thermodesulfatator sp.]
MPEFSYEAINHKGERISGTSSAPSRDEMAASLVAKGLQPVQLKRLRSFETFFEFKKNKIGIDDVLYFTSELSDLLEAGVPLERSLTILADATDKKDVRKLVLDLRDSIHGGKSLSEALGAYPDVFDKLYVNMIKVGELGGVLPGVLNRLGDFMERSRQIRKFIISSSIYPSILAFVGLVSVFILVTFVVPKFGQIFQDLNQPMPLMTRLILDASLFLQQWWWLIFLILLLAYMLFRFQINTPEGRARWDELKLRLPLMSKFIKQVELGRFARTLGTLLESGVPILKGISLASEVVGNTVIKQAVQELYKGVRQGKSLSLLMRKSGIFPSLMIHLVSVGEETGGLPRMLLKIADDFDDQVQSETKIFLNMLEPITIVVMGVVIGGIIMSMLLAIFGINDVSF